MTFRHKKLVLVMTMSQIHMTLKSENYSLAGHLFLGWKKLILER